MGRSHLSASGLRVHAGDAPTESPLLGGAYGVPLGWATVTVAGGDGRLWRVATRQPEEFTRAVEQLASGPRTTAPGPGAEASEH